MPYGGKELVVARKLMLLSVLCVILVISTSAEASKEKLNSSLKFLKHLDSRPGLKSKLDRVYVGAADPELVTVTVKFDHVLSGSEIDDCGELGLSFFYLGNGEIARTEAIYPAKMPLAAVDALAARVEVLRIEASWNPAVYPLLDVSNPETEADSAWTYTDPMGYPITGKGTRIADFDTGIDVFHPSFFYADGDTFDWIDVDGFGTLTPGVDAVDLNHNDIADANEMIRYWDGWIYDPAQVWGSGGTSNVGNGYQIYWDWLYNDANNNVERDYGPGDGFSEGDPTYGELLFIPLDENGDGFIMTGEPLVALHTSKIYGTYNANDVERYRGTDLIDSDQDTNGHGTAVSGILAGGIRDQHIFTGIAPDAEILMGYFFSDNPISVLIPWARANGANAMLYEFGGFIWRYLDGSSLDEELVTIENRTIIQITPSGNLGRGNKHAVLSLAHGTSETLNISIPTYGGDPIYYWWNTTLWREEGGGTDELEFYMRTPIGTEIILAPYDNYVDGYYIYVEITASSRGTAMLNCYVDYGSNADATGTWELRIVRGISVDPVPPLEIISNVADHLSSWAGGAEFLNYASDDKNVTFPATSDSSFVNGSYSTRGFEGYYGVGGGSIPAGEISAFSGRGVRIDGWHLLDICSPGNYDVYSTRTHQASDGYPLGCYRQFSGTSAAGPHVAAAAALVQQAFPTASMEDVAFLLTAHAATDGFTGTVYNDTWGYGKLRILGAIGAPTAVEDMAQGRETPRVLLDQNYPNPFNPTTWIPFYLPSDGFAVVKIYNVRGELVKTLRNKWMSRGPHSITWNGDDEKRRPVASGIYFCVLRFGGEMQSRKLILLR
jgi:subtilisin family serine protease